MGPSTTAAMQPTIQLAENGNRGPGDSGSAGIASAAVDPAAELLACAAELRGMETRISTAERAHAVAEVAAAAAKRERDGLLRAVRKLRQEHAGIVARQQRWIEHPLPDGIDPMLAIPDVLLQRILRWLPMRSVYNGAILVCRRWRRIVATPSIRRAFELETRLCKYATGSYNPQQVLGGHEGAVWGIAMSADGRTAFSVSDDATVKTWAVPSCSAQDYADRSHLPAMTCDDGPRPPILASCERTLSGHGGPVYAVVVDDAAGVVYTGSADMTIKAWSVADGSCLRTLAGHFADISQLVLDPDGKRLFSASDDNTVGVWSTEDGANLAMLTGHVGPVTALVHDRAQQRLFSASFDTSIRVWTTVVGDTAVYRTLRGQHGAPLVALALSDGSSARQKARLYSASSDGRVTTWDVGGRGPGSAPTVLQVFEVQDFWKQQTPQRLLLVDTRLFVGTTQGGIHEYRIDANGVPCTGVPGATAHGNPAVVTLDHMFGGGAERVTSNNRIGVPGPDRVLWGEALAATNYAMPSQYGTVFALASTSHLGAGAFSKRGDWYWLLSGLRNGGILVH